MLDSFTLKFTENADILLPASGVTVLVGPNNSGKSLLLKEIESAILSDKQLDSKILSDFSIIWPDANIFDDILKKYRIPDNLNTPADHITLGQLKPGGTIEKKVVHESSLRSIVTNKENKHWLCSNFVRWGIVRLDGRSRFDLTNDQKGGDLTKSANNIFSHLFQDDSTREKIRDIVYEAVGSYFIIDPTELGSLRIKLSDDPPLTDEQSLNAAARSYHSKALHVKDASDGVQAFIGIIIAVMSGDAHTMLVDEPEAFLHPPLARKLGHFLAKHASETTGTLLVATHSSDFVMGCIQGNPEVRIIRMEYGQGKSRARIVDTKEVESLFKKPLLRSANAASALFYDGVVVTESDNDRAFYQEIFHRISEVEKSCPSILFINAQNKQTIRDLVGPLRKFGVPAAAIADIDLLKDGGQTWTDWMRAAHIPQGLHIGYGQQRSAVNQSLVATKKNMKTEGGVALLTNSQRLAADQFFDSLNEYGVFPIRGGELESWLKALKVSGKGTEWTIGMLNALGSDPKSCSYIRPTKGDVWDFMRQIVKWITDSGRKGLV